MPQIPEYRKFFGAKHDSASGGTQEKWEYVLKIYARHLGVSFPMAARPWCGICVEHGASRVILDGQELLPATQEAMTKYRDYRPRDWDDGKDREEFEAFQEYMPDMILFAVNALQKFFQQANRVEGNKQEWHKEPKIDVPILLYRDFFGAGLQVDLKCKPPLRNPIKKDGTRTWRVPKPEITPTWLQTQQQSVYWKASGEPPALLYVSAAGYHIATAENCEQLSEQNLERAYQEVVRSWIISQNLLKAANGNWHDLAGLVQPDFNEIARRHGPSIVDVAKQLWSF